MEYQSARSKTTPRVAVGSRHEGSEEDGPLPIVFVKQWDKASPKLLNVIATNETLTTVTFEFYRPSPIGLLELFYTIKLSNAHISSYHQYVGSASEVDEETAPQLEDIGLTYQSLTASSGGITAIDNWVSPII